jgi:hypothetical protein
LASQPGECCGWWCRLQSTARFPTLRKRVPIWEGASVTAPLPVDAFLSWCMAVGRVSAVDLLPWPA